MSSEGQEPLQALVQADAIRVTVELVRVGAGHGTAHESAEALRQCLLVLHAMSCLNTQSARVYVYTYIYIYICVYLYIYTYMCVYICASAEAPR